MRVPAQSRSAALGRKPLRIELTAAFRDNPIPCYETSRDLSEAVIPGSQSEVYAEIHTAPFDKGELRSFSIDKSLNRNSEASALLAYNDVDLSKKILFQ